jgi:hypothetical protein
MPTAVEGSGRPILVKPPPLSVREAAWRESSSGMDRHRFPVRRDGRATCHASGAAEESRLGRGERLLTGETGTGRISGACHSSRLLPIGGPFYTQLRRDSRPLRKPVLGHRKAPSPARTDQRGLLRRLAAGSCSWMSWSAGASPAGKASESDGRWSGSAGGIRNPGGLGSIRGPIGRRIECLRKALRPDLFYRLRIEIDLPSLRQDLTHALRGPLRRNGVELDRGALEAPVHKGPAIAGAEKRWEQRPRTRGILKKQV